MNEVAINKNLYKIFLSVIKFTPIILALIQLLCTILNIFHISNLYLSCLGGSSLLFILVLYLISYVFKYCYLYRIPLNYVTVIIILKAFTSLCNLEVYTMWIFRLHIVITGLFIVTFIYYMYKNRKSKKVDYIKELCQRYCDY